MRHVLWIGGPPRAGKTTIAVRLARRYGLRVYSADTRTWAHRDRAVAAGVPAALAWEALPPDERWALSPEELFDMSLHNERGAMVVEDLQSLPTSPLIVAEGSTLPAWAVSAGVAQADRTVWLMPTATFLDAQLAATATPPGQAKLYRYLRDQLDVECPEHRPGIVPIDGIGTLASGYETVERLFAAPLSAGPRAESAKERAQLLRELNESLATQVYGFCSRSWVKEDPGEVRRLFVCECGDVACDAEVEMTAGDVAAGKGVDAHGG